jgi:hypothetical protein
MCTKEDLAVGTFGFVISSAKELNPHLTITVTHRGDWFEVESFDTNGLRFRDRSFEPGFLDSLRANYLRSQR